MRFMLFVLGDEVTEGGAMPDEEMLATMGRYNEELAKAGVLLDLSGLQPTSKGARIEYSGKKRTITDGPFTEAKEVVAGYWLIETKTRDEAIEWAKRVPFEEGAVELRQLFELEDFEPSPAVERARELGKKLGIVK
jgi:hypothetical protein